MKKILLSFVLVLALISIASADIPNSSDVAVLMSASGDITFLPSVTMLSTTTCPACVQMEKVLKQAASDYAGKFQTSHIYLEDNPDIAKKHKVRYVPMLIFRDSSGKEIAQKVGFMQLKELVKVFEDSGVKL